MYLHSVGGVNQTSTSIDSSFASSLSRHFLDMFISRCTDDPIILILTNFPAKIGVTKKPLIFKQAKFLEPVLCGAKRYKIGEQFFWSRLGSVGKKCCFRKKELKHTRSVNVNDFIEKLLADAFFKQTARVVFLCRFLGQHSFSDSETVPDSASLT